MQAFASSTIRTILVIGFLLVPPMAAIPALSARMNAWWNGRLAQWQTTNTGDEEATSTTAWVAASPVKETLADPVSQLAPTLTSVSHPVSPTPSDPEVLSENTRTQMSAVSDQLQALGATSTELQSLGPTPPHYRFLCAVPLEDSVYSRTFEESGEDPLVLMERVLSQVKSWRGSTQGPIVREVDARLGIGT